MQSLWEATCNMPSFDPLPGDIRTDALVIGAGMAGILTAYLLQSWGRKTVLLEANRVCGGVTKGTTAKITSQHNLIYAKLIETIGLRAAQAIRRRQRAGGGRIPFSYPCQWHRL